MAFEQAVIKVEKEAEFGQLQSAIARVLQPPVVERFLKKVRSQDLRIRQVGPVLQAGIVDALDETLKGSGTKAEALYQSLPASDQGQIREFYLSAVEKIEPALRLKFQKLFQYY